MDNEKPNQTVNVYKRVANFTRKEEEKVIALVLKDCDIIESKKSDAVTSKLKKEAWENIATEFNLDSDQFRDARAIREKYKNIKRRLQRNKKRNEAESMERSESGCPTSKRKKVCTGGVIDELCEVIGINTNDFNSSIYDDQEEEMLYLDTDLPEQAESVIIHEAIQPSEISDYTSPEIDKISVLSDNTDESQYHLPKFSQPRQKVRSKYNKKQDEVCSEKDSLIALEKQILKEQLRNLKTENENAASERILRMEQAAKEHRLRMKYAETEHILRTELLRVQIKLHQKNLSKKRA